MKKRHFLMLLTVVLIALVVLSGCAALKNFLALEQGPEESDAAFAGRQDAAAAKVAAGTSVLFGILSVLWPPGVVLLGTAFVVIRKYKPYHDMLVAVIKAIDNAAPGKADDEPVKSAVRALDNAPLNKIVYDTTH